MSNTHIIILAGGKGTRMKSETPKVLTLVKGIPIITRLLKKIEGICNTPTIIVGYKGGEVIAGTHNLYHYVEQKEQKGTGHAIQCAKSSLSQRKDIESIVVLPGDHPLVSAETIQKLIEAKSAGATVALATLIVPHYEGEYGLFLNYGRIIRDAQNNVIGNIEFKDADEVVKAGKEVNLSYYCFDAKWLWENIDSLGDANASHEYYLTDLIARAHAQHKSIVACPVSNPDEAMGINTAEQLAIVESRI